MWHDWWCISLLCLSRLQVLLCGNSTSVKITNQRLFFFLTQVCDSDTMLDPASSVEMVKVLEEDPMVGGVGGDVQVSFVLDCFIVIHIAITPHRKKKSLSIPLQILNKYESWISFLSSVRYWMAFNIERACQSYFGCVQCISGPLGMYRNSLLCEFLEDWYNQTFMGSHCSFGDDRHLTNRVLSLGYATKYTARSKCLTETPITYLRWLNQQTRWSKSYFREWLYNSMWFHKHHLWMTYEAVITGFFPFFLIVTAIQLFYQGRLWNILLFLLIVQAVALIKSSFASLLRGNIVMVFMSFYSVLYMSSLLPAKMFAIATINKSGWGTSGRKTIVVNFIGLIPISVWFSILFIGIIYTIIQQTRKPFPETEKIVVIVGAVVYASYWVILLSLYSVLINKCGKRKKESHYDMVLDVWHILILITKVSFWVVFMQKMLLKVKATLEFKLVRRRRGKILNGNIWGNDSGCLYGPFLHL